MKNKKVILLILAVLVVLNLVSVLVVQKLKKDEVVVVNNNENVNQNVNEIVGKESETGLQDTKDFYTDKVSNDYYPGKVSEINNDTKKYQNEHWGFEFNYPADWNLEEKFDYNYDYGVGKTVVDVSKVTDRTHIVYGGGLVYEYASFVVLIKDKKNISLKELSDKILNQFRYAELTKKDIRNIAGIDVEYREYQYFFDNHYFATIEHNGLVYSLLIYKDINGYLIEENKKYYDELQAILDSFTFTK